MNIINNIDGSKFSFNGITYFKNFTPIVRGEKTQLVNTYDSKIQLNDFEDYSQYNVDGVVYGNVEDLQNALLPIVFTRFSLGGEFVSSLTKPKEIQVNFTPALQQSPYVPTAGSETTISEIVAYINSRKISIVTNELALILIPVKKTINNIVTVFNSKYMFAKNNIGGDWGTGTINGEINKYDLIFISSDIPTPDTSVNDIVIELGDILTDDIVTYLNNNPQPTSGQNWELEANRNYWFSYTSNGSDIVDFYKGQKPAILGNQSSGDYQVNSSDFQRISTDGVISTSENTSQDFPYSQILLPSKREPLIPVDTNNFHIRENGNIIFSEVLGKYVTTWSQGSIPYIGSNVNVYMAISDNLESGWQIVGKIVDIGSEDPYLIEENGALYVMFEIKINQIHDDIGYYKLTDTNDLLNGWNNMGYLLQKDPLKDWQSTDVSSPVYIRENGISYLFFEGRGGVNGVNQSGATGVATSTGIEEIFTHQDLIISGSGFDGREADVKWISHMVVDDIVKLGDYYYLNTHSLKPSIGQFVTVVLRSTNLLNGWEEVLGTEVTYTNKINNSNGSGAPFYKGKTIIIEPGGLYLGYWGQGIISPISNLSQVTNVGNVTDKKIIASKYFKNKGLNDFAQVADAKIKLRSEKFQFNSGLQQFYLPTSCDFFFGVYINGVFTNNYNYSEEDRKLTILGPLNSGDIINIVYRQGDDDSIWFDFNGGTEADIGIKTIDGSDWTIDWGDGNVNTYPSSESYAYHNYSTPFYGSVKIYANPVFFRSRKGSFNFTNIKAFENINHLYLNENNFTGEMSGVSQLKNIEYLYINGSGFTGDLTNYSNLIKTKYLYIRGDYFTGEMSGLRSLDALEFLRLEAPFTGDMFATSKLPSFYYFRINGNFQFFYLSNLTSDFENFTIRLESGQLSSPTDIDNLLIDIDNNATNKVGIVDLRSDGAASPTAASASAIASLQSKGRNVLTN